MKARNLKMGCAIAIFSTTLLASCGPGGDSKRTGDDFERNQDREDTGRDDADMNAQRDHTGVNQGDTTDHETMD